MKTVIVHSIAVVQEGQTVDAVHGPVVDHDLGRLCVRISRVVNQLSDGRKGPPVRRGIRGQIFRVCLDRITLKM